MARRRLLIVPGAALVLGMLLASLAAGAVAGGMGCHAGIERDAAESQVVLTSSCMDPLIARVPEGGVVTFTNADKIPHAITGAANTWGTYDELHGGSSVSYRFTRSGVFPYFCYIHPGMIGVIVVGDGSPGGGGDSVRLAVGGASQVVASPAPATPAPATPATTPQPAASAAAAAVAPTPSEAEGASLTAPTSLFTIALLTIMVAAGAAYGLGLLPGRRTRRANPR